MKSLFQDIGFGFLMGIALIALCFFALFAVPSILFLASLSYSKMKVVSNEWTLI